jgi:septal ring factor EnvC (AmiA/AmiB activator)
MIVAHDGGYHTLYAQAERLEGSVGDVVAPGAVIARSGPPHGQGLYFEIRRNGAPLDPLLWLKSD